MNTELLLTTQCGMDTINLVRMSSPGSALRTYVIETICGPNKEEDIQYDGARALALYLTKVTATFLVVTE